MKGIKFITDDQNNRQAVIIDLKTIENHEDEIHDFIDVLIAENRKNDPAVDWEEAKKILIKER